VVPFSTTIFKQDHKQQRDIHPISILYHPGVRPAEVIMGKISPAPQGADGLLNKQDIQNK